MLKGHLLLSLPYGEYFYFWTFKNNMGKLNARISVKKNDSFNGFVECDTGVSYKGGEEVSENYNDRYMGMDIRNALTIVNNKVYFTVPLTETVAQEYKKSLTLRLQ